jgi:hypothetical protein
MAYLKKSLHILIFGAVFGILAQEVKVAEEFITDRPDATESPISVPKKSLQIETGGFFETYKENETKTKTLGYNTTLLRYGLLDNFELRVGWNFEKIRTSINSIELDNLESGFSPLLLGMKVEIASENNLLPDIGLLIHLAMPFTAATDYKTESTGVDFRFAFAHTLSEKSAIAYNLGAQWSGDSPEASYVYTLSYGHTLSEKFGAYAEIYGDFPENSKANHFGDVGLTYLIRNNIQLDATIGKSFTKGQDILISTGISYRYPN